MTDPPSFGPPDDNGSATEIELEAHWSAARTPLPELLNLAAWAYQWWWGKDNTNPCLDSLGLAVMHGMPQGPAVGDRLAAARNKESQ